MAPTGSADASAPVRRDAASLNDTERIQPIGNDPAAIAVPIRQRTVERETPLRLNEDSLPMADDPVRIFKQI